MSAPFGQGGEDPLSGPVVTPANFSGDTVMLPDDNNNNTNKKPPTHSPTSMEAPETNFGGNNDATATTTAQSSAARQHEPCASMKKELIPASTNDPPIDNLKRFRFLFFGLLSLLIASAPGCFAIFGFYIQVVYEYTLEDMVDLFCIGTTVGMFCAFLMGILYDFYAQRLTISICVILIFISSLCFALIFDSRVDFQGSKTRFDILFFLMNAGGYSLKVISVVTMVTHLPRNRGMVCGVLETFFGLGASIYSCLFRGYFGSHFDDLMYFMAVFSLVVGIVVVIFFDTAPWADIRFFSRIRLMRTFKLLSSRVHITKGELQRNLNEHILKKVPYIKYSISTRRIRILFGVLMLTNFFLTGQIIGIAYGGITSRGVLCVFSTIAILLLCLLACVMLLPFKWIDGDVDFSLDEQDVDLDGEPLYRAHSPHEMEGIDANPLHGGSRSASINASMAAPSVTQMVFSADVASRMRSSNADEDESSDGDGSSGSGSYSSSTGSGSSYSSSSGSQHSATSSRTSLDQTQRLAMYERTDATGRVHHMSRANHVLAELKLLPQNKRLPINYETITEVIKYREGVFNALRTPEIWALMFMSFVVISTGIIITSNLFIQVFYASVNKGSMEMNKYYLYAAISGVAIAAGRVSLSSIGDDLMPLLRKKLHKPYQIPFTYLLIIPPWIIVLALILFLSIGPADGLLVGYVVVSFGFGLSTSIIPYSLTTFYSYEHVGVGKAYGICEACAGLGVMAFYRGMFYELYHKKAFPMDFPLPQVRGMCLTGKKDCAQTYLIISLVLNVLAGCVAIYVHLRFQKRLLAAARAQIALVRDDDCIPVGRGAAAV